MALSFPRIGGESPMKYVYMYRTADSRQISNGFYYHMTFR